MTKPPSAAPAILPHAPAELFTTRLRRLSEGIGKVVYASQNWVVKRERSPNEVLALIAIWKIFRWTSGHLPGRIGHRLLERPSRRLRLLRVLIQALVLIIPRGIWLATHIGEMWRVYGHRSQRGERIAVERLTGTSLIPCRVTFPPVKVQIGGWPGWLTVCEAVERVEATLHHRLSQLANAGRYAEVEQWLERFLALRQSGWRLGVFSLDAHLKNFGVIGDRVVLLDSGGLTDSWADVETHLCFEDVASEPHIQLGLGSVLGSRPDLAERFNNRWRQVVSAQHVRLQWSASTSAGEGSPASNQLEAHTRS